MSPEEDEEWFCSDCAEDAILCSPAPHVSLTSREIKEHTEKQHYSSLDSTESRSPRPPSPLRTSVQVESESFESGYSSYRGYSSGSGGSVIGEADGDSIYREGDHQRESSSFGLDRSAVEAWTEILERVKKDYNMMRRERNRILLQVLPCIFDLYCIIYCVNNLININM